MRAAGRMERFVSELRSTMDVPAGYWAAYSYQIHVIPLNRPHRSDRKLVGACGILIPPGSTFAPDDRPVCSWCAYEVRCGRIRVVRAPGRR